MILDNYDDLADSREHIQNVQDSLELFIQDNDWIWKILSTHLSLSSATTF